jgi:AcrR family transcriptional regulator
LNPPASGYLLTITQGSPGERRYGGRTAEQRRADRRERLLDAGLERFGTAGYAATTIEGLCAEASLNARYFYEQFRSREELLGAVYERHAAMVFERVSAALEAAADPAIRLEAGLRAFVEATLADERGARINYIEMVGVSVALEHLRRRIERAYTELITQEAARLPRIGTRPTEERRTIAVALVGAVDGLIRDWLSGDRTQPGSTVLDTLLTVFGPTVS